MLKINDYLSASRKTRLSAQSATNGGKTGNRRRDVMCKRFVWPPLVPGLQLMAFKFMFKLHLLL